MPTQPADADARVCWPRALRTAARNLLGDALGEAMPAVHAAIEGIEVIPERVPAKSRGADQAKDARATLLDSGDPSAVATPTIRPEARREPPWSAIKQTGLLVVPSRNLDGGNGNDVTVGVGLNECAT